MDSQTFQPDLAEAALEARILPAYAPTIPGTILTTGGYIVLTTPPGLSSALNTTGGGAPGSGSNGSSGGNMATSFNISGFGPSSLTIGNVTGFPALAGGRGATGTSVSLNITVGSGANDPNGGAPPVSRFAFASGGPLADPGGTGFLYIGREFGASMTPNTQGTSTNGTAPNGTPAPVDNTPPPQAPPPAIPGANSPINPNPLPSIGDTGAPRL